MRQPLSMIKQHWRQIHKSLSTGLVFTLLVGHTSFACAEDQATEPAPKVTVSKVHASEQGLSQTLYCVVSTPFIYQAASHGEAELISVLPNGTSVRKGQLIAKQDDFYMQQSLKALNIDIELAQAQQQHAINEHQRRSVLQKRNLLSHSQLDQSSLDVTSAKLRLDSLTNDKQSLKRRIERLSHRAPFDAQVLKADAMPGERLAEGQNIFQLLPLNKKQLECQAPVRMADSLNLSTGTNASKQQNAHGSQKPLKFEIEHKGSTHPSDQAPPYTAQLTLRQISKDLNVSTQNLTAYFNYEGGLLIGQRVSVRVNHEQSDVTQVPYDAITLNGSSYQMWAVNEDNTVSKINPKVLSTSSDYFVVQSPLRAGDQVITRGQKNLKEQQRVAIVERSDS